MKEFNPIEHIENSELILDQGNWPNFHDAEIHDLQFWRGDMRPDDNVFIGATIEASFELCAIQNPYIAILKFHDCEQIEMNGFNHNNIIEELNFNFEDRGNFTDGTPLPPFILVSLISSFGLDLSFKCFRAEAIKRK